MGGLKSLGKFVEKAGRDVGKVVSKTAHAVEKHALRPVVHAVRAPFESKKTYVDVKPQPLRLGEPDILSEAHVLSGVAVADALEALRSAGFPQEIWELVRNNIEVEKRMARESLVPCGVSSMTYFSVSAEFDDTTGHVSVEYVVATASVSTSASNDVTTTTKGSVLGIRTHRGTSTCGQARGLTADECELIRVRLATALGGVTGQAQATIAA